MQLLTHTQADEVSPVERAANRRRFLLRKSADTVELSPELTDVLTQPHENEGAFTDLLRKGGVSEEGIEAAVVAARLLKGFEDELPEGLRVDVDAVLKAKTPPANADEEDGDCDDVAMAKAAEAIKSEDELVQAITKADGKDLPKTIEQLAKAARALGLTRLLPQSWASDGNVEKEDHDMPEGDVSVAVPVKKEDGSWDLSGVAPEARPFYEDVLKARDAAEAEAKTLTDRVEKAETAAAATQEELRTAESVQKAAEYAHVAPAEELSPVLKEAQAKLEPETFEKLEGILKAAQERIAKGNVFSEFGSKLEGSESAGDAMAQLEKMAAELVEKSSDPLSPEQAFDRVLKTAEGAALYAQYKGETAGAVS